MAGRLDGKAAVVTGAARGVEREVALAFAREAARKRGKGGEAVAFTRRWVPRSCP